LNKTTFSVSRGALFIGALSNAEPFEFKLDGGILFPFSDQQTNTPHWHPFGRPLSVLSNPTRIERSIYRGRFIVGVVQG